MTIRPSVVIAEVEDFVKRFSSGELILAPEAKDYSDIQTIGKNFLGRPKIVKTKLPSALGYYIATYQFQTDINPRARLETAYELLAMIQRARAFGIIKDPKQQTKDYEHEIEQLKERINSLIKLNDKLVQENKTLHNFVGHKSKGKGDTEIGDVTK